MNRLTERRNGKLTLKKQFPTIQDTLSVIANRLELYEDLEEQLTNKYHELKNIIYGDGIESYTTGYKYGHRNGQIELLEQTLNIDTGCRQEAEKALEVENE